MKVLHVGSTGNLGRRVVPALLAHGHEVVALVRSADKLRSILPASIYSSIEIVVGDGFDQDGIARVLRQHNCDAVINTAGTREPRGQLQTLPILVASITGAAITVGKERGRPLRAWIVGGFGSLQYPGTGYQIQGFMPEFMTAYHHGTERVMKAIASDELRWSLLCVAMMFAESETLVVQTRMVPLSVASDSPPDWHDHWLRSIPLVGNYLNLLPIIPTYKASYGDVADLLAKGLSMNDCLGELTAYKPVPKEKLS